MAGTTDKTSGNNHKVINTMHQHKLNAHYSHLHRSQFRLYKDSLQKKKKPSSRAVDD